MKRKNLLYEKIKQLLIDSACYRNSDRRLIWRIWEEQGLTGGGGVYINFGQFMLATSPETIRRTRQKVQQDFPELQSDKSVLKVKKSIEAQKGTHVYREPFTGKLFD